MNALERTLIEKAGYDNGWEVVIESTSSQVELASALHRSRARVEGQTEGSKWLLTVPEGPLTDELVRAEPSHHKGGGRFRVDNDTELGRVLRHAARLARSLPDLPQVRFVAAVERELARTGPAATEVDRFVRQRVGQDIYRESLLDYWGGACAVTGIQLPSLLRASHAKPWAECATDGERLNVFNGFLLAAHLDALFDCGLITFDDDGGAQFSPKVDSTIRSELGIARPLRLRWLAPGHKQFLQWHRDYVFSI